MDRRLTPATTRAAHISLRGRIDSPVFTEGQTLRLTVPLADLRRAPGGARERQLLLGESFTVIDRDQDHAFGFAVKDGYCGWLEESALADTPQPTHWVASPATHLYPEPRVQAPELAALSLGCRLSVLAASGKWAETSQGFVPASHLRPLGEWLDDPVTVAEGLLGTPYLWGGNSRAGLDCSGLVQLAHAACGIGLPGDSDLQESAGDDLPEASPLQRGDLLFWKGHVAMATDPARLIHANGHTMSVAYEPVEACIARVMAQEGRPVTHRRRLA